MEVQAPHIDYEALSPLMALVHVGYLGVFVAVGAALSVRFHHGRLET